MHMNHVLHTDHALISNVNLCCKSIFSKTSVQRSCFKQRQYEMVKQFNRKFALTFVMVREKYILTLPGLLAFLTVWPKTLERHLHENVPLAFIIYVRTLLSYECEISQK